MPVQANASAYHCMPVPVVAQRRDGGVRLRAIDEGEALFRFKRNGDESRRVEQFERGRLAPL